MAEPKLRRAEVRVMEDMVSTHSLRGTEGELNTAGMIYEHRKIGILCLNAPQDLTCAFQGVDTNAGRHQAPLDKRTRLEAYISRTDARILRTNYRIIYGGSYRLQESTKSKRYMSRFSDRGRLCPAQIPMRPLCRVCFITRYSVGS